MAGPFGERSWKWARRLMRLSLVGPAILCLVAVQDASAQGDPGGELVVFAASSLTEAFTELADGFEQLNPTVRVLLNFAGSSILSVQILEGAPAEVFASADSVQMQRVSDGGLLLDRSSLFAINELVVVATRDGPVSSFEDLGLPGIKLVLAGPEVPAGRYARAALDALDMSVAEPGEVGGSMDDRILSNVVSEEPNVRLVAAKVALGEADAGIVYGTDARAFPELESYVLPSGLGPLPEYHIAALRSTAQPESAADFVAFVLSPAGGEILKAHGFGVP